MTVANTWQGVAEAAARHGAKFPELVAAQWALESGFGKVPSGKNNYFGIKSESSAGTVKDTLEEVNGKMQSEKARFKDFESLDDCIAYLVKLWYKDYKSYKGANNAASRSAAAQHLVREGYATDSNYAKKLIELMNEHAPAKPVQNATAATTKSLFTITALQSTFLKKETRASDELTAKQLVRVDKGKTYGVAEIKELAKDSHHWVNLASGAGEWYVFAPHWRKGLSSSGEKPRPGASLLLVQSPNWGDFNQNVTQNLTVGEILQWDARRKPVPGSATERRILDTAVQFQQIRNAWGRPLGVTSFYRPEPINRQVGGVPNSRHVYGDAMDIYPDYGRMNEFYNWIRVRWTGGLGDGRDRGFIHLDCRSGGGFAPGAGRMPAVVWTY